MVAVVFFPLHCPWCDPEPQLLEADLGDVVPISVPVSDTEPDWEISRNVIKKLRIKIVK